MNGSRLRRRLVLMGMAAAGLVGLVRSTSSLVLAQSLEAACEPSRQQAAAGFTSMTASGHCSASTAARSQPTPAAAMTGAINISTSWKPAPSSAADLP
jgi:hypothetical protein